MKQAHILTHQLTFFFSIYNGRYDNFEDYFKRFKIEEHRLPDNIVAIGDDSGGNLICISVSGSDAGAVYFWDHEQEAFLSGLEKADYHNLHLIADSFDEFLSGLH